MTNVYKECDAAMLKVKPELGKMVMWYNHLVDQDTNWIGELDENSLHGGCGVTKGEKWIGNFWITVSDEVEKDLDSVVETTKDEL